MGGLVSQNCISRWSWDKWRLGQDVDFVLREHSIFSLVLYRIATLRFEHGACCRQSLVTVLLIRTFIEWLRPYIYILTIKDSRKLPQCKHDFRFNFRSIIELNKQANDQNRLHEATIPDTDYNIRYWASWLCE